MYYVDIILLIQESLIMENVLVKFHSKSAYILKRSKKLPKSYNLYTINGILSDLRAVALD